MELFRLAVLEPEPTVGDVAPNMHHAAARVPSESSGKGLAAPERHAPWATRHGSPRYGGGYRSYRSGRRELSAPGRRWLRSARSHGDAECSCQWRPFQARGRQLCEGAAPPSHGDGRDRSWTCVLHKTGLCMFLNTEDHIKSEWGVERPPEEYDPLKKARASIPCCKYLVTFPRCRQWERQGLAH